MRRTLPGERVGRKEQYLRMRKGTKGILLAALIAWEARHGYTPLPGGFNHETPRGKMAGT